MIMSDRDKFIGFHATEETKEKIRAEAAKRDMSMSALISEIVEGWLELKEKAEGIQLIPRKGNPMEADIPLPFSG